MGVLTAAVMMTGSIAAVPTSAIEQEQVDLIEVNRYYDDHGRLVFKQLIFYDWCPHSARFQVRDWRLVKCPKQLPRRNWRRGGYDIVWYDGQILRRVRADAMFETWTQHDPELQERKHLPQKDRIGLSRR